ncbi:unnamed protein product [Caenorhabditis brenneri]
MAIVTLAKRPDDVCFPGRLRSLDQHHRNLVINPITPQKVPQRSTDVLSTTIKASPLKDPMEKDSDENTHEDEVEGIVEDQLITGQPSFDDDSDDDTYFEFLSKGALLEGPTKINRCEMRSAPIDTLPPVKSAGVPEPVGPDKDAPTGSASPQERQEENAEEAPPPAEQQPQEQAPSSGDSEGSSSPTQPPRGIPGQSSSSDEIPDLEDDPPVREPIVAEDAVAPVVRPDFGPPQQQADREGDVPRGYPGEPQPQFIFHNEEPNREEESSSDSSGDSSDSSDRYFDDEERPDIPLPEYYVDPDDEQEEEEEPEEEQNPPRNSGTSDSSPDSGSSGSRSSGGPSSRDSEESNNAPVDREDSPMPGAPLGEEEDEEEAAEMGQNQDSSPDDEESEDANPLKRPHGDGGGDDESGDSKRPHMA